MKKRFIEVLAAFSSMCLLASGCGSSTNNNAASSKVIADENVTAPGELPIVKDKITLTVGIMSSSKVKDYDTNAFTKFLEDKTNIDLEFYQFPESGGFEKANVMLASGSKLPDVLCGMWLDNSAIQKYGQDGTFVDLTNYINEYGYWMKEVYDKTKIKNLDGWLKSADGRNYFMPHIIEQEGNVYGGKAFINKKWLDKLDLEMPETIDDFCEVMKAFRTQDPNGNGKADELGFTGSQNGWNEKPVNFLMNSYIYDDYNTNGFIVDDNGKISLNYMSEDYKEGVKKIAQMVKDGLIDKQCYSQPTDTLRSICNSDDNVVGAFASGSPDNLFGSGSERLGEYVALPPLKGPKGVAYAYKSNYTAQCSGFITKDCKYPLAAYRLLDFMMSEEASLFERYGVEGEDWLRVDDSTPAMFADLGFKAKILPKLAYGETQNSHWFQYNPAFRSSDMSDTMAWNGDPLDGEYVKAKALSAYEGKGPENIVTNEQIKLDPDTLKEYADLRTAIQNYVHETVALFITGEKDIDTGWDEFQSTIKNLNVDRYLELAQQGYDNFNNMGKSE